MPKAEATTTYISFCRRASGHLATKCRRGSVPISFHQRRHMVDTYQSKIRANGIMLPVAGKYVLRTIQHAVLMSRFLKKCGLRWFHFYTASSSEGTKSNVQQWHEQRFACIRFVCNHTNVLRSKLGKQLIFRRCFNEVSYVFRFNLQNQVQIQV